MLRLTSELIGICEPLDEVGNKVEAPIILHVDSQVAVRQITGEDSSGRAKHIAVRHKFVKDYRKKVCSRGGIAILKRWGLT